MMLTTDSGFRGRLSDFARDHAKGWEHEHWLALLSDLSEAGADTSDPEGIGAALEEERLLFVLGEMGVKGLGPKRRHAVVERFGRLWDLKQASVEQLSELPSFNRGLAAALYEALH